VVQARRETRRRNDIRREDTCEQSPARREALRGKASFRMRERAQGRTDCIRSSEISAFEVTNGTPIAIS
jgi:hypothetical protein